MQNSSTFAQVVVRRLVEPINQKLNAKFYAQFRFYAKMKMNGNNKRQIENDSYIHNGVVDLKRKIQRNNETNLTGPPAKSIAK